MPFVLGRLLCQVNLRQFPLLPLLPSLHSSPTHVKFNNTVQSMFLSMFMEKIWLVPRHVRI